ncbi:DUF5615 family PIN-like protein [Botrimarina sp.]|uniref:DUF5615 family PIN-like protein n=1 Tax=Botrimarina sp. TaxID=2795802 RepID=UPI0032EE89EC
MIRFHLDECVDHSIADGLRKRGVDVTTSTEARLIESSDESQFDYAIREGRLLITHDRDFLRLTKTIVEHPGVIFAHPMFVEVGDVVRFCSELTLAFEPVEVRGLVHFVPFRQPRR